MDSKKAGPCIYSPLPPCLPLFLCLYGRTEKCELSIRDRGWGDRGREGGREVGEGGLEGGGRTRDTVGERGEEESETSGKGRTGNIEKRGEESQMIHQKCVDR